MLIQKLRLKRGWSQQQLADASGLNVRTIQRIEAGQPASPESLKCLAAVFEVDFATLTPENTMSSQAAAAVDSQEQLAFRQVRKLRAFYMHLLRYAVIVAGLWAMNLIVSPHRLWVLWVMAGWGIGLMAHAASVFSPRRFLGPDWERREVEKRLGRPL